MKREPDIAQSRGYGFEKPAKDRIVDASYQLYRIFGIRVGAGPIAHEARSNVATVTKYFGNCDPLVRQYVSSLIKECHEWWQDIEARHRHDPEAQLRLWVYLEQEQAADRFRPQALMSRTAAELPAEDPLLIQIKEYWRAERLRITNLCDSAGFERANDLADKLLLSVQGARNERAAFGGSPPSRLLSELGDDLMVMHGASRKPLLTQDDIED